MNTTKDRKSFWLPMVVLAVVFLLALGGCARGGNSSNTSGNQTTSGQTPGSTSTTTSGGSSVSDELNRLQQIDQQNQNDNNSLNTDDQNANQNNGSDQDTQPTASLNLTGAISVNTAAAPAAPVCTTLDCIQKFGDLRIQERVIALEKLKTDAQNNKNISDSVRTQVLGDVSSNEASLSAIKKQLDAETTIKAALADVKSIYALRIFAVILPRDYGEIELSHELNVIQRMTDAEPTIANLIQQDQAAGHDVSQVEHAVSGLQEQGGRRDHECQRRPGADSQPDPGQLSRHRSDTQNLSHRSEDCSPGPPGRGQRSASDVHDP